MKRRVVVTGLGAVTALGTKVNELWQALLRGQSGIRQITIIDPEVEKKLKVHFAGELSDWNPEEYISTKERNRIDRFAQFGLVAAIDAVRQSGLDFKAENPWRCGVIIGSGIGGLTEIEQQIERLILKGPDRVSAFTIPKMMANAASGHVSIHYGIKGINTAVATACASAANAIGDAFRAIQHGIADVMITGGAEATITPIAVAGFSNMRALSERNDDPQRASRPFDADRDGFVLSEGAGVLVLEEYEHAKARGANILCELLGYGASADGGHITQPDEHGTGAGKAMELALQDAQLNPAQVDYINAHGTSTPLGDAAETQAIKRVFGEHAYQVSVSSTKSQLGHMLGASGGVELVISVLSLQHQIAPPTINLNTPDPKCDLDYTPNTPKERSIRIAMSNSFGFGGHNASLIVGKLS
jgi:3-oxoacyl-[acyl-carrier-protein] synthase II